MLPPGYAAGFGWLITAVLWWSGWRAELADTLPVRSVSLFLAGWPLAFAVNVPVTEELSLNGTFVWTALHAIALFRLMESSRRWTSFAAGLLIAAVTLFLGSLFASASPGDAEAVLYAAILAGSASAFMLGSAAEQLAALMLGCLAASLAVSVWRENPAIQQSMGGAVRFHPWWMPILAARALSVAFHRCAKWLSGRRSRRNWRRGGEEY